MYVQTDNRIANRDPRHHYDALAGGAVILQQSVDWLSRLIPFTVPTVTPTVLNVLSIIRITCGYRNIPWRLAYTILEHEAGIHKFKHPDGVMQTIAEARQVQIPLIPRDLKLTVLGLPLSDQTPDKPLNTSMEQQFQSRLAVQIAVGVQELISNLRKFSGYVALAFAAYNVGAGRVSLLVTGGKFRSRASHINDQEWEEMCRFAASLLHQRSSDLRVGTGAWLCDPNLRTGRWIPRYGSNVFDKRSGIWLPGYQYLRSVRGCAPAEGPTSPCDFSVAKNKRVQSGTGILVCKNTRDGALDKLYNPKKLGRVYYEAVKNELVTIPEDNLPLKALNGRLVKSPLMSGQVLFSPAE